MKKSIFSILLISFMLHTLIGCSNTQIPTNTPDDTTGGDNSSAPAFVDVIKDYDTVDETSTDGFVIKSKKYDYEENNVVLLNVENHSEENYTVTVDMTYYDDAGNEIVKESQFFEGFDANWQKYFIFKPGRAFSSYKYTLTTEDFNGECYGKTFTFRFDGLEENRVNLGKDENGVAKGMGRGIRGKFLYKIEYSESLDHWLTAVFFNNKGEIYHIYEISKIGNKPSYMENEFSRALVLGTANSVEWPEELKGETSGILILNNIGIGITNLEY